MKILIIGYGSIGRRHAQVLESIDKDNIIHIVSKQILENKITFTSLESIDDIANYDYYVIASETNKHYEQLSFLEARVKNKTIFCEKPLFCEQKDLEIKNNHVVVGYVLRFHPILQKLKQLLQDETVFSVHINTGQYLPTWRENIDYRKSYSADKTKGGGVLLDLSHEIDYAQWLFGQFSTIKSFQIKISDLEINSDDLAMVLAKTEKNIMVNLSMDYINKITHRHMLVNTNMASYELDFIKHRLVHVDKQGVTKEYHFSALERNDLFVAMHETANKAKSNICTFREGQAVMKTISTIQEQNHE